MSAFYDGKYDVLLSTTSSKRPRHPDANTLIVHRADMFGLAQLYQLRGRVGRSKRAPMPISHARRTSKLTARRRSG
jgi:transcription-repair coupling factor (superfamily II helicase)